MRVSPDVKSFKKIQKHVIGGGPLENAVCSCLLIVFPKDSGPSSTEQVMYVRAVNGSQYRVCSVLKGRSFKKVSQKSITEAYLQTVRRTVRYSFQIDCLVWKE